MKKHHSKVLIDLIDKHSFVNMIEIGLGNGLTAKTILDVLIPSYPFVYYGIDPYFEYDEYNSDINSTSHRLFVNKQEEIAKNNNIPTSRKNIIFKIAIIVFLVFIFSSYLMQVLNYYTIKLKFLF